MNALIAAPQPLAQRADSQSPPQIGDDLMNAALAAFQTGLDDWTLGPLDLRNIIQTLREWSAELWDLFLAPLWDCDEIPPIHLCFRIAARNVLGTFQPGRNSAGLTREISVNPIALLHESKLVIASVVLHEMLHLVEHETRTTPSARNGYHSTWFRRHAQGLGIPVSKYGRMQPFLTRSPFMTWATHRGISSDTGFLRPVSDSPATDSQSHEGDSSAEPAPRRLPKRVTWVCSCDVPVAVQVARASTLDATCNRCTCAFQPR